MPDSANVKTHVSMFGTPWPGVAKRKLFITLALVLLMSVLIGALGQFWIKNSEPYHLGRAAVGSRLGVSTELVELKRLAPFQFSDGAWSGQALFVLCGPAAKCFTVVAKKRDARWSVVDLVER